MSKMKFLIVLATGFILVAGILFAGSGLVLGSEDDGPMLLAQKKDTGEEEIEGEDDFWGIFRRLFSAEEPDYEDEIKYTEVAGVRGIDREGRIEKVYDFDSVKWMEKFKVNPMRVKAFLEKRGLGPYKGKGKEEKS